MAEQLVEPLKKIKVIIENLLQQKSEVDTLVLEKATPRWDVYVAQQEERIREGHEIRWESLPQEMLLPIVDDLVQQTFGHFVSTLRGFPLSDDVEKRYFATAQVTRLLFLSMLGSDERWKALRGEGETPDIIRYLEGEVEEEGVSPELRLPLQLLKLFRERGLLEDVRNDVRVLRQITRKWEKSGINPIRIAVREAVADLMGRDDILPLAEISSFIEGHIRRKLDESKDGAFAQVPAGVAFLRILCETISVPVQRFLYFKQAGDRERTEWYSNLDRYIKAKGVHLLPFFSYAGVDALLEKMEEAGIRDVDRDEILQAISDTLSLGALPQYLINHMFMYGGSASWTYDHEKFVKLLSLLDQKPNVILLATVASGDEAAINPVQMQLRFPGAEWMAAEMVAATAPGYSIAIPSAGTYASKAALKYAGSLINALGKIDPRIGEWVSPDYEALKAITTDKMVERNVGPVLAKMFSLIYTYSQWLDVIASRCASELEKCIEALNELRDEEAANHFKAARRIWGEALTDDLRRLILFHPSLFGKEAKREMPRVLDLSVDVSLSDVDVDEIEGALAYLKSFMAITSSLHERWNEVRVEVERKHYSPVVAFVFSALQLLTGEDNLRRAFHEFMKGMFDLCSTYLPSEHSAVDIGTKVEVWETMKTVVDALGGGMYAYGAGFTLPRSSRGPLPQHLAYVLMGDDDISVGAIVRALEYLKNNYIKEGYIRRVGRREIRFLNLDEDERKNLVQQIDEILQYLMANSHLADETPRSIRDSGDSDWIAFLEKVTNCLNTLREKWRTEGIDFIAGAGSYLHRFSKYVSTIDDLRSWQLGLWEAIEESLDRPVREGEETTLKDLIGVEEEISEIRLTETLESILNFFANHPSIRSVITEESIETGEVPIEEIRGALSSNLGGEVQKFTEMFKEEYGEKGKEIWDALIREWEHQYGEGDDEVAYPLFVSLSLWQVVYGEEHPLVGAYETEEIIPPEEEVETVEEEEVAPPTPEEQVVSPPPTQEAPEESPSEEEEERLLRLIRLLKAIGFFNR